MTLTTYEQATGEHYTRRIESIEQGEKKDELVYSFIDKKGVPKRGVVKKNVVTSIDVDYDF